MIGVSCLQKREATSAQFSMAKSFLADVFSQLGFQLL